MRKLAVTLIVFVCLAAGFVPAAAQDDACDLDALSSAVADQAAALADATYDDVAGIQQEIDTLINDYVTNCANVNPTAPRTSSAAPMFNVQTTAAVNIRSCGSTTCDIVATSTNNQMYPVVGTDGDWYEIDLGNGETGFVASWLTVRGPDELIDIYEGYYDADLDCVIQATVARASSNDLHFAISGDAQNDVVVDIYRPNRTEPERVWTQLTKTFVDTGNVYVDQLYLSSYWPNGNYRISLERDGQTKVYGFELNQTGRATIYVDCD